MLVTVFTPALEGMVDDDHPPIVYRGELSEKQLEKEAAELGGVGTGGYVRFRIVRDEYSARIEYSNHGSEDDEDEDEENPEVDVHNWDGNLSYTVTVTALKSP